MIFLVEAPEAKLIQLFISELPVIVLADRIGASNIPIPIGILPVRSVHPLGRYVPKCWDTQRHRQTHPAQPFSPIHQCELPDVKAC